MGQRNILCTSQMKDLQMDQQGQVYRHPEPCIVFGGMPNFPQPSTQSLATASGSGANCEVHQLSEHSDAVLYGMAQYNAIPSHAGATNVDSGFLAAPNFYNFPMASSSITIAPGHQNNGSAGQLSSSSHNGYVGFSVDEQGRNNHFLDVEGSCKRKITGGFPGNYQYINASAGSSSLVTPHNPIHPEGITGMDASSFVLPQYRGNGGPSVVERRSYGNPSSSVPIGMDPIRMHNHYHGSYIGQTFPSAGTHWLDQQPSSNCGDGVASAWNQVPAVPYIHGAAFNGGSMEVGNVGVQGYNEPAGNRSSMSYLLPTHIDHWLHNLHHPPPPPVQGLRGHEFPFQPPASAASYRVLTYNSSRGAVASRDMLGMGPRQPPTGFRLYRPHRGETVPETRHRYFPPLRVMQADQVAILDVPEFYEVGSYVDRHRDMRLDIEDMSYEELLALGEQIGSVNTGLSEETIVSQLKTRTYSQTVSADHLEEATCMRPEADSCIICQDNYRNQEKIGTLDCGHEYHAGCLQKWLLVKNVCPVCKSEALPAERKNV